MPTRAIYTNFPGTSIRKEGHEFTQPNGAWSHDSGEVIKKVEQALVRYEATYGPFPHLVYGVVWECKDLGEVTGKPDCRRLRLVELHHRVTVEQK